MRRAALALLLVAACARERATARVIAAPDAAPAAPPPAVADLRAAWADTVDVIYFAPEPTTELAPALARCAARLTLIESPPSKPPPSDQAVWFSRVDPTTALPVPSPDELRYFGRDVTSAQVDALQRSKTALFLGFHAPRAHTVRMLRESDALALCVARATGGLIWDAVTRQLFSESAWKEARIDGWKGDTPDVLSLTVVHCYATGELARSVSLGLGKLGLPDLAVPQHPRSLQLETGLLIARAGQAMWARGALGPGGTLEVTVDDDQLAEVKKRGGTGRVTLRLVEGKHDEGDADNRLLDIRFDSPEEHGAALRQLLGVEETVVYQHGTETEGNETGAILERRGR